ncbi:endolytic transglycosylase MltG [candidate division WWE3 bacterium]|nr:endolytic transglycosylase MltG [candidate division WWE3 bacterium]
MEKEVQKELDPKKFHVLDQTKKNILLVSLAVVVFVLMPFLTYYYMKFAVNRPSQTPDEHTIEIKSGWGVSKIADELYSEDIINSEFLFTLFVLVNNLEGNIQAGVYTIPAGTSIKELGQLLQHGTKDVAITLLEGWRVEQFALEASEMYENVNYEDFVHLAQDDEGYLFPDTYVFPSDVTTEVMVEHLKDTFETKTADVLTPEALQRAGLTEDEVVIMASIVEREVADPYDRPLVAGVLVKRYKDDQTIGADATVQYYASLLRVGCTLNSEAVCPHEEVAREIDWWPYSLTLEELDYESDYNTRKYVGLPPAPISSVSVSALESVLNYKETSYTYYLTDREGVTHFAETLEEHENNINLYLR